MKRLPYSAAIRTRFAEEYVQDLNATQAYIRARGREVRGAKHRGYELLQEPDVRAHIAALQRERAERSVLSAQWVLDRLRENAIEALAAADRSAANRALELIGKHLGMFTDRIDHSGTLRHEHQEPYSAEVRLTPEECREQLLALFSEADSTSENGKPTH